MHRFERGNRRLGSNHGSLKSVEQRISARFENSLVDYNKGGKIFLSKETKKSHQGVTGKSDLCRYWTMDEVHRDL
jgi:hypothetical protein